MADGHIPIARPPSGVAMTDTKPNQVIRVSSPRTVTARAGVDTPNPSFLAPPPTFRRGPFAPTHDDRSPQPPSQAIPGARGSRLVTSRESASSPAGGPRRPGRPRPHGAGRRGRCAGRTPRPCRSTSRRRLTGSPATSAMCTCRSSPPSARNAAMAARERATAPSYERVERLRGVRPAEVNSQSVSPSQPLPSHGAGIGAPRQLVGGDVVLVGREVLEQAAERQRGRRRAGRRSARRRVRPPSSGTSSAAGRARRAGARPRCRTAVAPTGSRSRAGMS